MSSIHITHLEDCYAIAVFIAHHRSAIKSQSDCCQVPGWETIKGLKQECNVIQLAKNPNGKIIPPGPENPY